MSHGRVVSIYVTPAAGAKPEAVTEARAESGRGLEGDRYWKALGTYSGKKSPDREVTLIESESLEALRRDYGLELGPGESRRNVVTKGVALNHLVGREFLVGPVRLRGIKLCEPCGHLGGLTDERAKTGLVHRGGLRAQIVAGGVLRPGDEIREAE